MIDVTTNVLYPPPLKYACIKKGASIQEKIFELCGGFSRKHHLKCLALQWRSKLKTNVSGEHVDQTHNLSTNRLRNQRLLDLAPPGSEDMFGGAKDEFFSIHH